jgi:transcriptional regulator with XRE-family HTH domain
VTAPRRDTLPHRIATVRRRLGLAQRAFAQRIGVSRNAVIRYEGGRNRLRADTLARILFPHVTDGPMYPAVQKDGSPHPKAGARRYVKGDRRRDFVKSWRDSLPGSRLQRGAAAQLSANRGPGHRE